MSDGLFKLVVAEMVAKADTARVHELLAKYRVVIEVMEEALKARAKEAS